MATGRLKIRPNGLWCYSEFLPWRKLTHYEWDGDDLLVTIESHFPYAMGTARLPIPPRHKTYLNDLLNRYVTAAAD